MSDAARKLATFDDLAALGDASAEIIQGVIVYKAEPSAEHGDAQLALGAFLRQHFHRKGGPAGPGGWWILTEVDIALAEHEIYRPDVAGWRRDRVIERPTGRPLAVRPDFIGEILSDSNASTDQVDKFRGYAASSVPFYWIADPSRKILTVYRLEGTGYAVALQAKHGEIVYAPPFEALALRIGLLFGDDPD
ncbi:MAG TPA: Uma2 family endonuclease [Polyangiaceae bacterium]